MVISVLASLFRGMLVVLILGILLSQLGLADVRGSLFFSGEQDLIACGELVTGSGTETDPYVLSGLRIDASGTDYGLYIENVSPYLVIRNCEIFGASNPYACGGIVLSNSTSVTIERCLIHDNRIGIKISHCAGATITGNMIIGNGLGIRLDLLSRGNTITGNYFDNETNAIAFAPNLWSDQRHGNCWSDFQDSPEEGLSIHRIAQQNIDYAPSSTARCPHLPPTLGDTVPPVIQLRGYAMVYVEVHSAFHDPGATAWDDRDGDLGMIKPEGEVVTSDLGTYKLRYAAADSAGNVAEAIRTVTVRDTTPPKIMLQGEELIYVEVKTDFADPGVQASDNYDGDISGKVEPEGYVDTSLLGSYKLTYTAIDSCGNRSSPMYRTVCVVDTTPPHIELLGENPARIALGNVYEDPGATAVDNYDGDLAEEITREGVELVDTAAPGTYKVTYFVTDSSGNVSPRLHRTVIVGWPESVTVGSITGIFESVDVGAHITTVSIRVRDEVSTPSKYQYPLQLAELLFKAKEALSWLSDSDLGFKIIDSQGEVMMGTLPAMIEVSAPDRSLPIVLLDRVNVERLRHDCCVNYQTGPVTTTEAQQRIQAVIKPVLAQRIQVSVQIAQVLLNNGNIGYQVSLFYKARMDENNEGPKLSDLRESTALLELATFLALARRVASISVTIYLDLYGIIYRNDLMLHSATTGAPLIDSSSDIRSYWNETYVHPLLQ